jgi:hypothetical protein
VRVVGLPAVLVPEPRAHLARWSEEGPDGRVFVGPKGATPRRSNFNRAWSASLVRGRCQRQRARRDREREIAATVSARVEQALGKRDK